MTLSKRFMTGILSTALVFAFLCIGCDTGGGEDGSIPAPTVDKSTLIAGITAAENAKAGVAVGTQAEVARDLPYVSRAAMDALDAAIAEAQTRKNDKSATQADVKTAVEALAAAVVAFMSHVKTDGIKTSGFTADDLRALIDLAEEAERGVTISADGMDLPSSIYWVTQSVADAFLAAIDAAEDTTSASNIDSAYTALVNALNVFKAATQPGRKAKTVTITGLPADFNRSNMYIGLSLTSKLTGNPAVSGNATVQNGSLTVSLSNEDGNPWAGTGSWYVLLYSNSKGYITESPVSFTAKDAVSVAYVGFKEAEVETVGSVKGSVTLNNVPAPRPAVRILALYGEGWYPIDMLGTGGIVNADGSFEIPFSQGFLTALQTGGQTIRFRLIIGSDESNYQINLPEKAVTAGGLSGRDLNVGNIGAASLTTLTLSGTLVVQDGSQSVPRVDIRAHGDNGSLGRVSLSSPSVNGEPWSLTVATQQGEIYFSVTGYDSLNGENQLFSTLFYPSKTAMVSASDKSIDNINLDCGDVSTGRLSGTIAFTNMPSPAPYWIGIFAEYDNDSSWRQIDGYSEVSLSGTSGTWRLPRDDTFLAALNSRDRKVRFEVQVQFTSNENAVTFAAIEKTIGRSSLSGIDLGSVSLALITLNGTVKVNNGGQPIPQVEIIAHTENRDALGGVRLPSPPVGGQTWSITILPQQGEKVYFHVSGYDTDEKRLFSKSFEPPETVSVSSQSISGINFDIGDLKHTVTFVNNGFSMPISVLDGMSLGAAYPSNESMGAPSNGFISDAQYKVFTGWRDQDGNGVHEWTPIQKDLTVQPTFYEIPATDAITVGTDAPQTVTLKLEIDISETRVNGHKYFRLVQSDGLQADHVYKVEADYTITSPTGFHFVSFSASLDQYGWHADWLNDLTTSGSVSISIPNKVPADSKNQTAYLDDALHFFVDFGQDDATVAAYAGQEITVVFSKLLVTDEGVPPVVTFNVNGGDGANVPVETTIGKLFAASELPAVAKAGKVLKGWSTSASGTPQVDPTTIEVAGDTTYYAIWADQEWVTSLGTGNQIQNIPVSTFADDAYIEVVYEGASSPGTNYWLGALCDSKWDSKIRISTPPTALEPVDGKVIFKVRFLVSTVKTAVGSTLTINNWNDDLPGVGANLITFAAPPEVPEIPADAVVLWQE